MAKTALQFRHNDRDVAVFVDGGVNLLTTLRDLVGDMTPKFGCGQGGCGACTVLIDGDAHLACLTLAESVEGRSVETLDGLKEGPNLHPLQRAFMEHFAAQCGSTALYRVSPVEKATLASWARMCPRMFRTIQRWTVSVWARHLDLT